MSTEITRREYFEVLGYPGIWSLYPIDITEELINTNQ